MTTDRLPGYPITWHGKDPTVTGHCPDCGGDSGEGWATHKGECPTVALPDEVKARLHAALRDNDRARMRAAAEARTAVIG